MLPGLPVCPDPAHRQRTFPQSKSQCSSPQTFSPPKRYACGCQTPATDLYLQRVRESQTVQVDSAGPLCKPEGHPAFG